MRELFPDTGRLRKLFFRSAHDLIDGAELFHERLALLLADAFDLVETEERLRLLCKFRK